MNPSRRRLSLAAAALPALAACSSMMPPPDLKTPKLAFGGLSVPRIGLSEVDFLLTVIADNPNDLEVPLSNIRFDLDLFGQAFASGGTREPTLTLPRLGSREVPIEFTVPTSRLVELISRVRRNGVERFEYRLRGSANWGSSPFAIPFEKSGDLEALRQLGKLFRLPAG